jgi:CRP-like cAMP-binding protein
VILKEGKSFGELALISPNPRAATITAREELELATFSKEDYNKLLGFKEKQSLVERLQFLKRITILK